MVNKTKCVIILYSTDVVGFSYIKLFCGEFLLPVTNIRVYVAILAFVGAGQTGGGTGR